MNRNISKKTGLFLVISLVLIFSSNALAETGGEVGGKWGWFFPLESNMNDTYGNTWLGGIQGKWWFEDWGIQIDAEHYQKDRLVEFSKEELKEMSTNLTKDMPYATTKMYTTPLWFSILKRVNIYSLWKTYVGIGSGPVFMKELYKEVVWNDKALPNPDWQYTEQSIKDTYIGFQIVLGSSFFEKAGFELKYSLIKIKDSDIKDIGGLTITINMMF